MASRFFLSLTAFSLAFSVSAFTEQFSVSNEQAQEEFSEEDQIAEGDHDTDENKPSSEPRRRVAFPQKNAVTDQKQEKTETPPEQMKVKPHYAGVRKPKPKPANAPKRKSSKIKNEWFSSKTHPKVEKKGAVQEEVTTVSTELPEDRPFYIRKSQLTAQNSSTDSTLKGGPMYSSKGPSQEQIEEGQNYPEGGFQAPEGHVYLTAEYLLWRTRQEGMEFATVRKVNFEFNSGFRVGLGVHLPHDFWDIYINYTNFHPEHSHSVQGSFYPLFLFEGAIAPDLQGPFVTEARAHWEIDFQNIDVEIGRAYYIAKTLTFRPFIGLKGAWIDQHAKIHYEGGFIPSEQTFRTHFKNDFKGAGPLIGIESNWQLGAGFSLFGDLAAALIVGQFENRQEQHQINDSEVVNFKSTFNLVSPFLQMVAGVAWDRNFNRDRCHFGLSAGFETQYWWSQNQIEQFTDQNAPIYVREKGDLAFYGLTLRGRFDF
jgi:hypothetical protein